MVTQLRGRARKVARSKTYLLSGIIMTPTRETQHMDYCIRIAMEGKEGQITLTSWVL